MKKHAYILMLTGLILLGFYLRLYNISEQSLWMDEGYTVNAVYSILENGNMVLDSGQNYFCPMYCYPASYISRIFGVNNFSFRIFSVIAGTFFILCVFFVTKHFFNLKVAILSSFFTTFSYWQIAWSRQARWYSLFSVFFLLSVYFFYRFGKSEDKKEQFIYLGSSTFFTILSILTHKLAFLLPMIFVAWIIFKKYQIKKSLAVAFLCIFIISLDYILNFNFIPALFSKLSFHYSLPYYLSFYFREYWLFIFFSLVALFSYCKKEKIYFLLLPIIFYFLSLSFLTDIIHYRYLFHLTGILYILGSLGIVMTYDKIKKKIFKVAFMLTVMLIFFYSGHGVIFAKTNYYLESDNPEKLNRPYYAYTPQPDFEKAYQKVKENLKKDDIIISSHPHFNKIYLQEPGYWLKYNYAGIDNRITAISENHEYYVNAMVINNLNKLQETMKNKHGYILFDFMSIDGRIPDDLIKYIQENTTQYYYNEVNIFSKIWVYKF